MGAAGLVGLLAQISIHLSFTPVPITGQTLGVLLAGSALGWRRAGLSMALYVLAGLAGVPWFASHASGYAGATFGYLLGFIAAGMLLGWLASRGSDRTIVRSALAMLAGEVLALRDRGAVAGRGLARLARQGVLTWHVALRRG